jgi:hypothetical protein
VPLGHPHTGTPPLTSNTVTPQDEGTQHVYAECSAGVGTLFQHRPLPSGSYFPIVQPANSRRCEHRRSAIQFHSHQHEEIGLDALAGATAMFTVHAFGIPIAPVAVWFAVLVCDCLFNEYVLMGQL